MTQTTLSLSDDLCLPLDIAGEVVGILAKRGAGKTNTGAVIVEELNAAGVSPLSSGFRANVSTLSGFEMISYPEPGLVRAADLLFLQDAVAA